MLLRAMMWPVGLLLMLAAMPLSAAQQEPIPNTMEQRLAACSQCHGEHGQGLVDNPKIPHLASKPAGYLYQQLKSFQTSRRDYSAMQYVVRHLDSDYLHKIAHYYAAQPMEHHQQPIPEVTEEMMQRGEELVKHGRPNEKLPSCQDCHGERLTGVKPMIPGIVGLSYDYLYAQLQNWRSGERSAESTHCMWLVATRIRKDDVKAVSAWLASQPIPEDDSLIDASELPEPLPDWCHLEDSEVTP